MSRRTLGRTVAFAWIVTRAVSGAFAQTSALASVDSSGVQANNDCFDPAFSADGRFVAFLSDATNLVAGDTNFSTDGFVHDRQTHLTERADVDSSGAQANGPCDGIAISGDGRFVAFSSGASNLVAGDTNGCDDIFVRDRATGVTEIVSVDSSGVEGNFTSNGPAISADGRFVAFLSGATNLVPGIKNIVFHVYVHDRTTGMTELVSVDSSGNPGDFGSNRCAISADGNVVAFASDATNLVAGDVNFDTDVFVRDRAAGTTVMASVDSNGAQGFSTSDWPAISGDGLLVAFESAANLDVNVSTSAQEIFLRDLKAGTTEVVSVSSAGVAANQECDAPSLSNDGRYLAFSTWDATFTTDPSNVFGTNVFVRDRAKGTTTWRSANAAGKASNGSSGDGDNHEYQVISGNGQFVAFWSDASDLVAVDANQRDDIFVNGASLTLIADPTSAPAGATMTFTSFTGKAGGPQTLVAVDVDGTPMFLKVEMGTFDATGLFTLSGVVPFGLTGHVVTLVVFGILPSGSLGVSNPEVVTFQ